jgi:hypothetical protein
MVGPIFHSSLLSRVYCQSSAFISQTVQNMRHQQLTRRDLLKAAALVVAGSSLPGCGGSQRDASPEPHDPQPAQTGQALKARDMGPALDRTFVWKAVASGARGPGARSRHGLVLDSAAKANVLFGGILWTKGGSLLGDTWEFRGGQWSEIHVVTSPPARQRKEMAIPRRSGVRSSPSRPRKKHLERKARPPAGSEGPGNSWTSSPPRPRSALPPREFGRS